MRPPGRIAARRTPPPRPAKDEAPRTPREETAKAGGEARGLRTPPRRLPRRLWRPPLLTAPPSSPARSRERLSNVSIPKGSPFAVGALAVAAVLVVAFLAFFGTSWIGPWAPEPEPVPQVQPPSDGSIAPLEADDEEPEGEALPEDAPEVRSAVEDYSWRSSRRSLPSSRRQAPTTRPSSWRSATTFCAAGGELDGTQTKDLGAHGRNHRLDARGRLPPGRERSDGSGKAGISLIAEEPLRDPRARRGRGCHELGGHDASRLVAMSSPSFSPDDVADSIVEVTKTTNPVQGRGTTG